MSRISWFKKPLTFLKIVCQKKDFDSHNLLNPQGRHVHIDVNNCNVYPNYNFYSKSQQNSTQKFVVEKPFA